jgi:hypothetical protein
VAETHFHARQAAAALLKLARTTSDPRVAAALIEAAADLKEQVGELSLPVSTKPPDGADGTMRPPQCAVRLRSGSSIEARLIIAAASRGPLVCYLLFGSERVSSQKKPGLRSIP